MGIAEIRRLKQLEDENTKLKRLVANLTLDKTMLQDALRKKCKALREALGRRPFPSGLWRERAEGRPSDRYGPIVVSRYRSRRDPQTALRMRKKELAAVWVRYGYRRLPVLLQREGWSANQKRIYRLYCEEGLSIRTKTIRRRRSFRYRVGRPAVCGANDTWAMDFVAERLFDGRPFQILPIVDCHTREALATCARTRFWAYQVIEELDRLARLRGKPRSIRVDNGPEFAGRMLDQWAYLNKIELDFSRPGKPTDNGFIEAFNGRLRAECLNASWFVSMADARQRIEEWRTDYNTERPHMALGGLTPKAYADQIDRARKFA